MPPSRARCRRPLYALAVTRHFLTGEELERDELSLLLDRAARLKMQRSDRAGEEQRAALALAGRSVALVFEHPSTRTRISFEVGIRELGGNAIVLREGEMQLSRGESPHDTALVLSRYVDAIAIRTGAHSLAEELAASAEVPVINMLTASHHPCQALADLLTLSERFGKLAGVRLAYVGDGNNVAHSLMLLGARAGLDLAVATPAELAPDQAIVARAQAACRATGGSVVVGTDAAAAASGAHALYTDVWVSMGDEEGADARRGLLRPFRIDDELMSRTSPDAIALHCLPAHPGEEISESVLYGEQSAVWDQAENRLHAQKALLEMLVEASAS